MTGVPDLLLVAVAGGLGAASRFLLDTVVARHNRWSTPLGTLVVNVTACFLLGMLTGWGLSLRQISEPKRPSLLSYDVVCLKK